MADEERREGRSECRGPDPAGRGDVLGVCALATIEGAQLMDRSEAFLRQAVELAHENVARGGRPFGAVLVKDGRVVATGVNEMHLAADPTAHAELQAVRAAALSLGSLRLDGCAVYASGHPCPMCLAAMRLVGIAEVAYAYSNEEGEPYGLSTAAAYADLAKPLAEQTMRIAHRPVRPEGRPHLYAAWQAATASRPSGPPEPG
jgi:tRNA(Arg) A34 adenosine deaminase TadA